MLHKVPREKEGETMRTRKKSAEPKVQLGSTSGEVKFKELALIPAFLHECFVDLEIKRQLFFAGRDDEFVFVKKERTSDGVKWYLKESKF